MSNSKFAKVRLNEAQEYRKVPLGSGFVEFAQSVSERFGVDVRHCTCFRYLDDDDDLVIISSEGEYAELKKNLPSKPLRFSFSSKEGPNPQPKGNDCEDNEDNLSTKITAANANTHCDQSLDLSDISPHQSSQTSSLLGSKPPGIRSCPFTFEPVKRS